MRPSRCAGVGRIACLVIALAMGILWLPFESSAGEPAGQEPDIEAEEAPEEQRSGSLLDEVLEAPALQSLEAMSREELEAQGFIFEETVTQTARAHATVFALTAGSVVSGAGHWHLDDSRTALTLLGMDLLAVSLIVGGIALRVNPTGRPAIDDRRREMWFFGSGLWGLSWLIDIFGTAYRDELGIPASTRRDVGWGVATRYEYWRPQDLSLRHLATTELNLRSRHFEGEARSSQELGWGMSDYEVTGRWFPFVGSRPDTRLGISTSGRMLRYRLDEPFQRHEATAKIQASLNLGQLYNHLEEMTIGVSAGLLVRGYRFLDDTDQWTPLQYAGTGLPMRLHLALNLTDQLRLKMEYKRATGSWAEHGPDPIGIPVIYLFYRSTDRIDLQVFSALGNSPGFGAGIQLWFGE